MEKHRFYYHVAVYWTKQFVYGSGEDFESLEKAKAKAQWLVEMGYGKRHTPIHIIKHCRSKIIEIIQMEGEPEKQKKMTREEEKIRAQTFINHLIANLRGGIPNECDFCKKPSASMSLHPEEAGAWICNDCLDKWERAERLKKTNQKSPSPSKSNPTEDKEGDV